MKAGQEIVSIVEEMRDSYLDYAMSVIVSRAIPDACDGLKPVHRRILFSMNETGCDFNKPYRKSARIVGEVMGKYHPHGDSAIYQSMVRMAQNFSMRVPLIDGQGNFGSMDGDAAAAMRYTESRMAKISHTLLDDIDKDTVEFQENYDGSEQEPRVLPARFPNLLVNGGGGIAVGMATNIPPHNLGEVIDALLLYLGNNEVTDEELMQVVPGPDFPTGGLILGHKGARSAIKTGRGSVMIRAKHHLEEYGNHGRQAIVFTEVPYQVNKALVLEKIGELVRDKKIEGIAEMRDESDKQGVRVVIELKKDIMPEVILNQLFSYTQLQTSFGVNMLALDRGRPRLMSLRDVLVIFARFREEVVTRRTAFLLNKARAKAHILIGLSIAVANIDEIIRLIRSAPDANAAKDLLLARSWKASNVEALIALVDDSRNKVVNGECHFTEAQAKAILEMKLSRLTGLEQEKINEELAELAAHIKDCLDILHSRQRVIEIITKELNEIKEEFATPRMTQFEESELETDIEDLIWS
jgi:DNA gyrase subunit A